MKRIIVTALCALAWLTLDAQVSPDQAVNFPSRYLWMGDKFRNVDLDKFFAEWEVWSDLIAKGAVADEYNDIFIKHFCENNSRDEHDSKYLTLPLYVKVIKYDCDITYESESGTIPFSDKLKTNVMPENIGYFTPVIGSDKKVLYMNPELENLLASYIGNPEEVSEEEIEKRRKPIAEYVPTTISHNDDGWFFLSYPNILEIVITNNGYYIDLVNANYSGECYFVPWNKEPLFFGQWIQ